MDMIVAAGGGERDVAVDGAILTGVRKAANPDAFLNERLMNDLRPTLFLAQLSNLLAGNISIVHGVTGSSRTFMGEEAAGVDAVRIALARIAAGQSDIALVGGAHNGEREDLLLLYDAGGHMLRRRLPRRSGSADRRRHGARLARRIPGAGERAAMPRRAAPSRSRGSRPCCRSARSRPAGADHRRARADVAQRGAAPRRAGMRRHLGRDRRGARDRRGTRFPASLRRRAGARHRQPSRPWVRAAICR